MRYIFHVPRNAKTISVTFRENSCKPLDVHAKYFYTLKTPLWHCTRRRRTRWSEWGVFGCCSRCVGFDRNYILFIISASTSNCLNVFKRNIWYTQFSRLLCMYRSWIVAAVMFSLSCSAAIYYRVLSLYPVWITNVKSHHCELRVSVVRCSCTIGFISRSKSLRKAARHSISCLFLSYSPAWLLVSVSMFSSTVPAYILCD